MANSRKSKKSQTAKNSKFKEEKEEQVSLRQIVKDERTRKITGAFLLLLAVFLFIAFTSYLFTWSEDQALVSHTSSILRNQANEKVANLLGYLGAYVSHQFFFNGFGVASYLFCSFFFITGVNLLFVRRIFSPWRNLRYVIVGLVFFSLSLAFITRGSVFPWGGAAGDLMSEWLIRFLGFIGTAALLLVSGLAFIIWRFNPVFRVPVLPKKEKPGNPVRENEVEQGARLFLEESFEEIRGNKLKGDGPGPVIPNYPDYEEFSNGDMKIIEKEIPGTEEMLKEPQPGKEKLPADQKTGEPPIPPQEKPIKRKNKEDTGLELEIKTIEPQQEPAIGKPPVFNPQTDYEPTLDLQNYKYPTLDLLDSHGSEKIVMDPAELDTNKNQIMSTLKNYDIDIQRISATVGPTVTLYEIIPSPGVRISRIKNLEDDIALSLAALGIRIIAPIPGKGTIGIEVPNVRKTVVGMKSMLASERFQSNNFSLPIAIGKKIDNENFIVDLASMPHLLMAGATGQGKSVGINTLLVSLLYKKHPSQLKLVLVDPKKVELSLYRVIERYFLAMLPGEEESIITDTKKVIYTLNALCIEMDNRYDLLKEAGCRNIKEYNEKFVKRKLNPLKGHQFLPFIVLVIDEFADLIMTAGKEVEMPIARLAQLARAVGIHLIIATQRPSVNIITGTIKANFPARVAFKVSSKIDSRTILDAGGAEQLIGKGDMLVSYNGEITRLQCAFVDTPEVERVAEFIGNQDNYPEQYYLPLYEDEKEMEGKSFDIGDRDEFFEQAARLIVQNQVGSTSLLQRRMKLGYNRAGRLMDQLEAAGIVGPSQGSKAREVLVKTEAELSGMLLN